MTTPEPGRVFNRIPSPPSESARYSVRRAGIPRGVDRVETHWAITPDFPLDQLDEGACVGFGISAELSADPVMLPTGQPFAFKLYRLAQAQDRAMGLNFPEGATVLGGLRAAREIGQIRGFAWAQTPDQLRDAVLSHGSVVVGSDWTVGMDRLTPEFLARPTGAVRGGHCWTIIGYVPRFRYRDTDGVVKTAEAYEAINSWGPGYGRQGRFFVLVDEANDLIFGRNGEAAIVTDTPIVPDPPVDPPAPAPSAVPTWLAVILAFIERIRRRS